MQSDWRGGHFGGRPEIKLIFNFKQKHKYRQNTQKDRQHTLHTLVTLYTTIFTLKKDLSLGCHEGIRFYGCEERPAAIDDRQSGLKHCQICMKLGVEISDFSAAGLKHCQMCNICQICMKLGFEILDFTFLCQCSA